jgi:hypothetical protein
MLKLFNIASAASLKFEVLKKRKRGVVDKKKNVEYTF